MLAARQMEETTMDNPITGKTAIIRISLDGGISHTAIPLIATLADAGARVVVVAELVGATSGVGYQLLQSQQLFDMAAAVSWTLTLVVFVLLMQSALASIENVLLRYRPQSERVK